MPSRDGVDSRAQVSGLCFVTLPRFARGRGFACHHANNFGVLRLPVHRGAEANVHEIGAQLHRDQW